MVPAVSRRIPRVLRYSGGGPAAPSRFAYGAFTLCGRRFHAVRLREGPLSTAAPTTPAGASPRPRFGLLRFRSPLLAESLLFSSPAGTEMFQFPALAPLRHPRIAPYLPVPAVFRSLSRPSSPPGALGIPHAPCFAFLLSSRPPPIARRGTRFGCVLQFALTLSLACAPCQ